MASPAASSPSPASSSAPSPPQQRQMPPPPSATSRRLPPPCWSNDETAALVEAYRDKWLTLRRGNLKAADWQEVSDVVARRCGASPPSKTALQCRHKIEKLRKRYRNEKRRLLSSSNRRASSPWIHFRTFDAMESGAAPGSGSGPPIVTVARPPPPPPSSEEEEDDEGKAHDSARRIHQSMSNGAGARFRTPKPEQRSNFSAKTDSFHKSATNKCPVPSKKRPMTDADPVAEVAWAIRQLGEGFLRVEQMKVEVGREVERMRVEMEMKRTKMILEWQQQTLHSLSRRAGDNMKRSKRDAFSTPRLDKI